VLEQVYLATDTTLKRQLARVQLRCGNLTAYFQQRRRALGRRLQ
jgi:hypothetical protein